VLADPGHDEHEHLAGWVGGAFDPEAFDLARINADVQLVDRVMRRRR